MLMSSTPTDPPFFSGALLASNSLYCCFLPSKQDDDGWEVISLQWNVEQRKFFATLKSCSMFSMERAHQAQCPRTAKFFFLLISFPSGVSQKSWCYVTLFVFYRYHLGGGFTFFYFHQYFGEDSHFEKNIFSTGLKIPSNNPYIRTVAKKPLPGFIASLSWKKYLPRSSGWSSW